MTSSVPAGAGGVDREGPVLIRQEHDYGCGIASLAMICGLTYSEVRAWLVENWPGGHSRSEDGPDEWLVSRGIYSGLVDYFLGCHGYVWRKVYAGWEQEPWPPEPFAPVHLAQVRQPSGNSHYVVMRGDGVVLDPLSDETRTLTDWKVDNVQGIWSLAAAEQHADTAEAAIERVREVHPPWQERVLSTVTTVCGRCRTPYPCPTVAALSSRPVQPESDDEDPEAVEHRILSHRSTERPYVAREPRRPRRPVQPESEQ